MCSIVMMSFNGSTLVDRLLFDRSPYDHKKLFFLLSLTISIKIHIIFCLIIITICYLKAHKKICHRKLDFRIQFNKSFSVYTLTRTVLFLPFNPFNISKIIFNFFIFSTKLARSWLCEFAMDILINRLSRI